MRCCGLSALGQLAACYKMSNSHCLTFSLVGGASVAQGMATAGQGLVQLWRGGSCGCDVWCEACCPVNRVFAERKPYLGGWARSSFEQGALCALAAMSSQASRYCAIPGDACFQCHGVSPCVTDPPQATLPLFIHYYGNKDAIHELGQTLSLPITLWRVTPRPSGANGSGRQLPIT